MSKKKKKRPVTPWNRIFGSTAKACFAQSAGKPMTAYGKCMSDRLTAARKGMGKPKRKKK